MTNVSEKIAPKIAQGQYAERVAEGIKIGTIGECNAEKEGKKVAAAEFFQIFFYGSLAVVYILTTTGHLTPRIAGIATLSLLPFEIIAYHKTMTLYGETARATLTIMAAISLAAMAAFSMLGISGDYSWTMCGGGFLVHVVRNLSELNDYRRLKRNPPKPPVCSKCHSQILA